MKILFLLSLLLISCTVSLASDSQTTYSDARDRKEQYEENQYFYKKIFEFEERIKKLEKEIIR